MDIQQILFLILLLVVGFLGFRLYGRVYRNIRLGKVTSEEAGDIQTRWKRVFLIAFGQKKMFKKPLIALMHGAIYVAFLFTQIELIEIIIDGLSGAHRFFAPTLGGVYTVVISTIEVLSILALVATIIFLVRRNVIRINRFEKPEMQGWPKKDANLILLGEILLIVGIMSMNMGDSMLQGLDEHYVDTGTFILSGNVGPMLLGGMDQSSLYVLERFGWWLHILVVFGFILYLPISKHLHIFLAFPNTYFARTSAPGTMSNMPEVMDEVKGMLGLVDTGGEMSEEIPEFGAKDVFDLPRIDLLGAYSCTECGRCTASCPANITGKKLSPRKIMMDVRDRMEEVSSYLEANDLSVAKGDDVTQLTVDNFDDGKSLFDRISKEEIHACTTCNACVEACPVLINPMAIILELRRYEILTEGSGPGDWLPMFTSLENTGAVWQLSQDRDAWTRES